MHRQPGLGSLPTSPSQPDVKAIISGSDIPANDEHSQQKPIPGIALVDANGKIVTANPIFRSLLDINPDQAGVNLQQKLSTDFANASDQLKTAFDAIHATSVELSGQNNSQVVLHIDALDKGTRFVLAQGNLQTKDSQIDSQTDSHDSLIDPLTQLGNRRLLEKALETWQPSAKHQSLALIMVDLDRFKPVNDTLGHGIGDSLLKLVAKRITRSARSDDVVLRLGGDEFVVLHPFGEEQAGAERLSQRLVEMIGRPFLINGHQVNVAASVGIAVLGQQTESVQDLLRHADLALYDAKASGRSTYRFFTAELEEQAVQRRELEISLRRALALKQFALVYQPQVDLPRGNITGFEALIRWNHDQRGIIPPNEFIPLAEETGEIMAIGEWVLRTACVEATKWPDHLHVAVNVSPLQFENDQFPDCIVSALESSGLPPRRLEIEITESILMNKPEKALEHLCAIQDLGVSIAMDDFGTGFSSLSNLNAFPFSKIKIDQAFVRGEQTDKSRALVNAIISLGDSLGMETLAEGVETKDQFNQLASGGCMSAQGYLISRPLPASDVTTFIANSINSGNES